jgi:hypothetical protein
MAGVDGCRDTLGKWLPLMVECFVRILRANERGIHIVYRSQDEVQNVFFFSSSQGILQCHETK